MKDSSRRLASCRALFSGQRRLRALRKTNRQPRSVLLAERLEDRTLLTSTLYVDFGDNFPGGTLSTTVGDFDSHVSGANPDMDGPRFADCRIAGCPDFAVGTDLDISVDDSVTAAWRAEVMEYTTRMYEPFDITVVELTAAAQIVNGHSVSAAADLDDISDTLGINEGDAENNDTYIVVGEFLLDGGSYNPASDYGGISTGTDIGGPNANDGTATVHLISGFNDSTDFNGPQIVHEAGHAFGLEHIYRQDTGAPPPLPAPTGVQYDQLHQSEVMSYLGYDTQGGHNFFSRVPTMDGDGNVNVNVLGNSPTPADSILNDVNIGPNPNLTYVTGTGTHDIITVTSTGPGTASVSIQPFQDAAYTTAIDFPGAGTGTTFSYNISTFVPILIDAGGRNDRIVIDGDLGTTVRVRGMQGTDDLVIQTGGASAAYVAGDPNNPDGIDGNPDLVGSVAYGGTTVNFREFEDTSDITIEDATSGSFTSFGSSSDVRLSVTGTGRMVTGQNNGSNILDVVFADATDMAIVGTGGNDDLTIDHSSGMVNGNINFSGGAGVDTLVIEGNAGPAIARETYLVGATQDAGRWVMDPDGSAGVGVTGVLNGDEMIVDFTGLDPVDTSTVAVNFDVFLTGGVDDVRFEDGGLLAGFLSVRVVDVGGTFETFRYTNKTNITIDSLGGNDILTSSDAAVGNGEVSRTLIGNDGDDLFQLGGSTLTAVGGIGNDVYAIVDDSSAATITINEQLGEGSDAVTFAPLATPGQSTDQSGATLATAGGVTVNMAAPGQQKNIEFGVNALPYLNYTSAPPVGVPFMTMDYELEYADVGTMSTHTANFDWGDGNSDAGTVTGSLGMGVVNGSHQFDTVDTFNVLATITDNEGLSTTDLAITDIMQFAILPDPKMPGFTALFVGGTVGIDILEFRQQSPTTIRAHLNSVKLGDFVFDGGIFAFTGSGNDIIAPRTTVTRNLTFEGGGDVDILKGSVGADMLFGQGGKDIIYGREGNDMIEGGDERDHIWGDEGDDTINGGVGNDVIRAGDGNDIVDGGSGNDKLKGENGHDLLLGRGNDDTLVGGKGHDVMFGGSGRDKLNGGKGNDLLLGDASTHDADPVATFSIYDEWVNSAAAIPGRIANIELGGGLNGANILASGITIFDDGKTDVLNGGKGSDWYLAFAIDKQKGFSPLDDFLSVL